MTLSKSSNLFLVTSPYHELGSKRELLKDCFPTISTRCKVIILKNYEGCWDIAEWSERMSTKYNI